MTLTDHDKAALRRIASATCIPGGEPARRAVADHLRRGFPNLDDAELAAVLLRLAVPLAQVVVANNLGGRATVGFVAGVATDLAALEIGDTP